MLHDPAVISRTRLNGSSTVMNSLPPKDKDAHGGRKNSSMDTSFPLLVFAPEGQPLSATGAATGALSGAHGRMAAEWSGLGIMSWRGWREVTCPSCRDLRTQ